MIISCNIVNILLVICAIISCSADSVFVENSPIVLTPLGGIRGSILKSRLGRDFLAFRGVPYAEKPLRFKDPVPVKPWVGIRNATEDGPMCIQYGNPDRMSEDCLLLNVYTNDLNPSEKKAVILFLHPGGFYSLSSQSNYTVGPEFLMDSDVVFVSANYRLGTLGFLSTGTKDATGNFGLKDQVMALRWIRDNIKHFGGDPKTVTLMGYSAGAMSTTLHLVSPMSRGLFKRMIVMSGSTTSQWDIPYDQLHLAKKQARLLNCSDESVEAIMDCLRAASIEDYSRTLPSMFEFAAVNPIIVFKPIIEQDFGQERFLTNDPTCLIEDGQFEPIEILTGITEYEFVFPAIDVFADQTLKFQMSSNFTKIAPICFLYERNTRESEIITSNLRSIFFPHKNNGTNDWLQFNGLTDLFADGVIGFGVHRFAQLASRYTKVFQYRFSYTGRYSHTYYPNDKPYGAVHHDDLLYLFHVPAMAPLFNRTDPEDHMVRSMTGLWSNFAKSGDPNIGDFAMETRWQPMTSTHNRYLDINESPAMQNNLYSHRYQVWNNLFPIENRCR